MSESGTRPVTSKVTLKIKMFQLIPLAPVLNVLGNMAGLSPVTSLRVLRFLKAIAPYQEEYDKVAKGISAKYGKEVISNGTVAYSFDDVPDDKVGHLNQDFKDLGEQEFEISVQPIDVTELMSKNALTHSHLLLLDRCGFITISDDEEEAPPPPVAQ